METCPPNATQSPRRRPRRLMVVGLISVLTLGACSGSGEDAGDTVPPSVTDDHARDTGPDFFPTPTSSPENGGVDGGDDGSAAASTTTEFDLAAQPSTPSIAPIPETGVPGIDSTDAFCRAWSEFGGSFQALALISAIGDPDAAFRLEVIAASTITEAVTTMEANLPAELEGERLALIADLAGPFFARAVVAEAELAVAGIEPQALRQLWLDALTAGGVDDPELEVVLPATIDGAALSAAVASFAATQLAIVDDEALVTNATIPLTEAYLAAACPDGGILAGNDVIGD